MNSRDLLERLVAFPTVSRDSNLDCIHFIRDYLAGFGVTSTIQPDATGQKANLYATIGPMVEGGVVLSGHTDVVPVDGQAWTTDPFTLTERDGKLYGRGACDMKGFLANALAALPAFVAGDLKRPIHLAFSYDEEVGCLGAVGLVNQMAQTIPAPEAVIVGEPSRMKLINGHKGSITYYTRVRGHSVHSSLVHTGVSAVMVAAKLVNWHTEQMAENMRRADPANPFNPNFTTLHCGVIHGGTAANIVASECEFVTDIRAIAGEDPADFRNRYESWIRAEVEPAMKAIAPDSGVDIIPRSSIRGLAPEQDGAAERLVRRLTGDNESGVVAYGTEAGIFQAKGWSTVVCGPGDIAQAHQPDEYIEISELAAGDAFMRKLAASLAT